MFLNLRCPFLNIEDPNKIKQAENIWRMFHSKFGICDTKYFRSHQTFDKYSVREQLWSVLLYNYNFR